MSDPYIGEIRPFAFGYYPGDDNWLPCDGATVSIQQYQALFAVIGTLYGGNGSSTFRLPNLPGLAMLGTGQGPGLQNHTLGQQSGQTYVTLNENQMPPHNHTVTGINAKTADTYSAPNNVSRLSRYFSSGTVNFAYTDQALTAGASLSEDTFTPYTGGGTDAQPHDNRQPWLAFTYAIACNGIFPVPE
ncbi:phage tail protein [Methylomonas methanica]|uniref:Tail Collar domain protein n=1 Tax=Methylomonas methanica (strain DSM 25384 / MC09) TaxID=857087 RepID=F9ZVK5_METMM|nr:tail fiber protein [Methylomonas methanica]AEG01987.1 Tail Collar domain protein [Methylomonas methanica MC09]